MIVCHVCGTENADTNKYCEGCGVELQAAAPAASTPVATPEPAPALESAPAPAVEAAPAPTPEPTSTPAPSDVVPTVGATMPGEKTMDEILAESASTPAPAAPVAEAVPVAEVAPTPTPAPEPTPAPVEAAPAAVVTPVPVAVPTPSTVTPSVPTSSTPVNARLIPRQFGALSNAQFPLNGERLVVGRFDPSTGPVDIDLTGLPGDSHVSRRHGEMFLENGKWMVRDLGSTNGIYVKRVGEDKFSPRLQAPAAVGNGDEIAFGNVMFVYRDGPEA